jgi:hypothetical protein
MIDADYRHAGGETVCLNHRSGGRGQCAIRFARKDMLCRRVPRGQQRQQPGAGANVENQCLVVTIDRKLQRAPVRRVPLLVPQHVVISTAKINVEGRKGKEGKKRKQERKKKKRQSEQVNKGKVLSSHGIPGP